MKPLQLQPDQKIDIGEQHSPTIVTVVTSEQDGLNPYAARILTVELRYPLLIPNDANVRVLP